MVKIPVRVRTADARLVEETVRVRQEEPSQGCADCAPRPAGDGVCLEEQDLLADMLSIADDLERALAAAGEASPIREGVALTHRGVMRILRKHGVERVEARAQPFDPRWHEAIGVVSADQRGVAPGTVVEVDRAGYRRGERLYRPARVVVAQ